MSDPPFPGYAVGSLALIADAYQMLNDVMSLVIALYAIKVRFSPCIFLRFIGTRVTPLSCPPQPSTHMGGIERRFSPHLAMVFSSARSAFPFLCRRLSASPIRQVCRPKIILHTTLIYLYSN